jgi:hypothetical protein
MLDLNSIVINALCAKGLNKTFAAVYPYCAAITSPGSG